jgi:hypothetical protein
MLDLHPRPAALSHSQTRQAPQGGEVSTSSGQLPAPSPQQHDHYEASAAAVIAALSRS